MRILFVISLVVLLALSVTAVSADSRPLLDQVRTGTIAGNSGGAFDYYTLKLPGAGKLVTLRMTYGPEHAYADRGIGFNVYADNGKRVGHSRPVEGRATEMALTISTDFPAVYLVQVYNYFPGFQLSYSLWPEGLVEAQAEVGAPASDGSAQNPARLVNLAQGQVPGLRHGSYDFYQFHHPGGKSIWIKMVYYPDHWIIADGVGFKVYQGSEEVAEGQPLGLDKHIRWVELAPAKPTTYLIQVYNYIPEILLDYQLAVTEHPVNQ
jgi:hypothetical protein